MRFIDFSSWQGAFTAIFSLALVTLIGIGIRMLVMMTLQQRRERQNRQINERLKTLIAAYKVLGGSFTGDLTVDPTHFGDLRRSAQAVEVDTAVLDVSPQAVEQGSDRRRRIRDAVEAALSDVILLGTEEQVRLAEHAARELVAGRPVHTHNLIVSLRNYIRKTLDLEPIPADLSIPAQGPTRPSSSGGRNSGGGGSGRGGGGAGGGMGGGAGGGGMGMGVGDSGENDPQSRS